MKHIFFLLIFIGITLSATAQSFASRCSVITTINDKYLPAGYQLDTAQDLTHHYKINFRRSYDATTYDGSPASEAFELLAGALKTSMIGVAYSAFGIDTSAAVGVHANFVITDVTRAWPCVTQGDRKDIYDACEDVFYISGYIDWDK